MPRITWRSVMVGLVLIGGLAFLVERLIVTDEEAIERLLDDLAEAFRDGDFEAVADCLDATYEAQGRDRRAAVQYARTLWRRYEPMGLEVNVIEIVVQGEAATAETALRFRVMGRPALVALGLGLVRSEAGWRIRSAVPSDWATPQLGP